MKNKNRKKIGIALLIILLALSLNAIIITYAKYITSEKATGQAEIADWSFEIVKEGEETKTIQLSNSTKKSTLTSGKIAPGTSGTIDIAIDGTGSEVGMDYQIDFINEKNKPQNLYFTARAENYDSIEKIEPFKGKILCNSENKIERYSFTWTWPYETGSNANEIAKNDKIDTQDANDISEYTFDILVTATQSN